jgi:hypothetical protein
MSKSIRETVVATLGFHGRQPDAVTESIVDALEMREAQIRADLTEAAANQGLDEDATSDTLQHIFATSEGDTSEATFDNVLAAIMSTSRVLSQQTARLADLR